MLDNSVLLDAADYQVAQHEMVVHNKIMYQQFDEGCTCHELIRVNDKFKRGLEPINILLERLLRVPDDLEETICPYWFLYF